MNKFLSIRILAAKGWRGLKAGDSVPSYCNECGRQRIHYILSFAKRGRDILAELQCEHEQLKRGDL